MRIQNIWRAQGTLEGLLARRKQSLRDWLSENGFRRTLEVELWCTKAGFAVGDMDVLNEELDRLAPSASVDQQSIHFEKVEVPVEESKPQPKPGRKRPRNALVELPTETHESDSDASEDETSNSESE